MLCVSQLLATEPEKRMAHRGVPCYKEGKITRYQRLLSTAK